MSDKKTLVVGATGHVGRRLVERLAPTDREVIAVAHHDTLPVLEGVQNQVVDLRDSRNTGRVMKNVDDVYLTLPEKGPQPLERERGVARNVIRAAADADVKHLVLGSALHAGHEGAGSAALANKAEIEKELAAYDVPYTILRPGLLLDVLLMRNDDVPADHLALPFEPSFGFGAIGVDDMAKAAALLFDAGPQNRAFDLHLPERTSGQDLQHVLGDLLDREIHYQDMAHEMERFVQGLDLGPQEKPIYAELLEYVATNDYIGKPLEIQQAVPEFEYNSLEQTLHEGPLRRRQDFPVAPRGAPSLR